MNAVRGSLAEEGKEKRRGEDIERGGEGEGERERSSRGRKRSRRRKGGEGCGVREVTSKSKILRLPRQVSLRYLFIHTRLLLLHSPEAAASNVDKIPASLSPHLFTLSLKATSSSSSLSLSSLTFASFYQVLE